jgi:hypothetical protein
MFNRISVVLVVSFLTALLLIPNISFARIYLFDNKLEINGSIEQKFNWKYNLKSWEKGTGPHNSRITPGGQVENRTQSNGGRYPQNNPTLFKTHFHIEALYHAYNDGETLLDVFTLWEYFYDWGVDINPAYERGIRARDREPFKTNGGDFEHMCRELYFNYVRGPWTLRVGKQMVVWGETGLQRTADVVNPVDLKAHIMGVDDWEDFKQGLWMFRGFYQTSFTNDLTFEWIVVPYDVKVIELPKEGTMYNSTYTGGFTSQFWRRWRHDEPNEHGLKDAQGGFRIRGFNWDWDWTLIYYNGYDPAPIVWDWGQRKNGYRPQTPIGFGLYNQGIGGFNLYAAEYNINQSFGNPLPSFPTQRLFRYYRTHNFGATATKYVYKMPFFGLFEIPLKANVRTEMAFKKGTRFNTQSFQAGNWLVDGRKKVDQFAFAIEVGKDFMPQWICKFNGQRSVDITFGYFVDWILDRPKRLALDGYNRGGGDRSSQSFSLDITTDWFKQELMTKFNFSHNVSGNGSFWAFIQYAPGVHWRFTLLPRIAWSNAGPYNNKGNASYKGYTEKNDSTNYIHFKIGYLF